MALWHFIDKDGLGVADEFDDGLVYLPGEDGFSREAADKQAAKIGKGVVAEFTGTPNWHARIEAEAKAKAETEEAERQRAQDEQAEAAEREVLAQRKREAENEIDAMLHPAKPETPEQAQRREINARFDALLEAAPSRKADVEKLRKAALEEV